MSAPDNQIPAPSTIPDAEATATAMSDAEADAEIGRPAILSPSNHPYAEIFPMMDGAAPPAELTTAMICTETKKA